MHKTRTAIPFSSFIHLATAPSATNNGQEVHWRGEILPSGDLLIRTWNGKPGSVRWQTCERLSPDFCLNGNPVHEMRRRVAELVDTHPYHYVEAM